jgi:hypothetical protein
VRAIAGHQWSAHVPRELPAAVEDEYIAEPTPPELAAIRAMVTDGMRVRPIPQRKAILQKFVPEVRVQSRKAIHPGVRLPLRGLVKCPEWWRRRELNPRPKQSAPRLLRA